MRRLLIAAALLLFMPLWAATKYIDSGCTNNGDGSAIDCAASAGAAGPWNRIENASFTCGNTYNVRGVHTTHGSNHSAGTTDGRYFGNSWGITANCTSPTALIIQPNGWTANGTGEKVYLDGTRPASASWAQCTWDGTACDCGPGNQNISVGTGGSTACTQTWWVTDNDSAPSGFQGGNGKKVIGAQRDDGSMTFRVAKPSQCSGSGNPFACCTGSGTGCGTVSMTNNTSGYNEKRCSTSTWKACNTDSDCPGEICSAKALEIDSFSWQQLNSDCIGANNPVRCCTGAGTGTCDELMVRWGSSLPTKPYIYYSGGGRGFLINDGSAFITIRGFNFRAHMAAAITSAPGTDNGVHDITVQDNHIFYNAEVTGVGDDYGIVFARTSNITIADNEIAYTGSEGLHLEARDANVATPITVSGNWYHDIGDQNVMGQGSQGTAQANTLGEHGGSGGTGNYTGSVFENNLIINLPHVVGQSNGIGIILENDNDGWIIRNNVFYNLAGPCIKADAKGSYIDASTSNHEIYNNLFIKCGQQPQGNEGDAIHFSVDASNQADGNKIYNNTFVNEAEGGIQADCFSCTSIANNLVRNNIFYDANGHKVLNWVSTTGAGNVLEYNLVSTSANPAITWLNVNRACADVDLAGTGNIENCPDPMFINIFTPDYHLLSGSPAIDAGTSTGMPVGRTTDINNTLAISHGTVNYGDANPIQNGTWDIGIDEFPVAGGTVILDVAATDAPDPVAAGANITYTLTYHNTGSASANNVFLVNILPSNITYVSCTGSCTSFPTGPVWSIGTLAASGSGSVTWTATVNNVGGGTIIRNDTYGITSDETGLITGAVDTTTVSSSNSRRGRIFPHGKR